MVTWIWVGGIIVALGGLIAIWPARGPQRRRVGTPNVLRKKAKQA
jgi:cytochrome c biogenesis factor